MSGFSKAALPASVTNNLQFTDKLLYIYTSGTTGLPKAAVIKNSRFYRWRGENVSTVEVESVISSVLEQVDSVVYGVDVPGVEGKAGMAAIVEDAAKFDLDSFLARLKAELPSYAIPLFVRLVSTIDLTGTFKFRKLDLVREGYNPSIVSDPLYFYNSSSGGYTPLDSCLYDEIVSMKCRL